jgi:type IV secretion system protein VirD4
LSSRSWLVPIFQYVTWCRTLALVRVLVNMIVRLLASKLDFVDGKPLPSYQHRLLMMLDEFPSLGKLDIMQESMAFIAGYGIKCYLICQDINQLQAHYGREEAITSNCHIQTAFPPNRIETAEHLSKLTGQTTVVKQQITTTSHRFGGLVNVSKSFHEVQRPLLTPDECMRMPGPVKDRNGMITEAGDMVIYCAGFPAIYGRQPLYFRDETFRARAAIEAPGRTDKVQTEQARETAAA